MIDAGIKDEVEKGEDGEVRTWLEQLDLADKVEKQWRKDVKDAIDVYRNDNYRADGETRKEIFNILWSNIETKRPALYNSSPRPDIRRRFRDKDELGKIISELMERASTYTIDCQDLDTVMIAAVNDMLLPGRAITRLRYKPTITGEGEDEEVSYEEVVYEQVQWNDFKHGPGSTWDEVDWESFTHRLTKAEVKEKFEGFEDKLTYTAMTTKSDKDLSDNDDTDESIFNRAYVYEIWHKEKREVIFIAPSYKDKVIGREDDPLKLIDFWPHPKPLYAIESSTSIIPMTEYSMYETLAKELEKTTKRIKNILNGLRLRGVYDSSIPEMQELFSSEENAFLPAKDLSRLIEKGGIASGVWTLDIKMYAEVLIQLFTYRESLIGQIYEITGISDIQRGDTKASETATAQEIKANYGAQRLQRQQTEVQRYARDMIRLTVEIIAEKFSNETISLMTGMNFPTQEDKMASQQLLAAAQQGAPIPPQNLEQAQQTLQSPTWEDINKIMKNDIQREYRIDIETNSTIQADQQEDQKNIGTLMTGMAQFMQAMAPAVQGGMVSPEAAKKLTQAIIRRFKLGRVVEDAFDEEVQQQQDPAQQAEEQKAQIEQQKGEFEIQKAQIELQTAQTEAEARQQELALEQQAREQEAALLRQKHQTDMEALQMKRLLNKESHEQKMRAANDS